MGAPYICNISCLRVKCHVIVVACRVSLLLNAGCETAVGTLAAARQNDRAVLSPAKVRYNFMECGVFF